MSHDKEASSEITLEAQKNKTILNENDNNKIEANNPAAEQSALAGLQKLVSENKLTQEDANLIAYNEGYLPWCEPAPLYPEQSTELKYPIEAFPKIMLEAIEEVVNAVQCPVSMACNSALSALSIATQGLANVRRAANLEGPINLFLLVIAESGERKTTVDNYFTRPIKEWEAQQKTKLQPLISEYLQDHEIWAAKKEALLADLKKSTRKNINSTELESNLRALSVNEPRKPITPIIIYMDSTPEALALNMATGWHSAALLSSEAGTIFGSYGMSKDSITRNLALLNILWEAGDFKCDRKTSASVHLKNARLTICLAVQPGTFISFLENCGGVARNIGFLARFLFAYPQSTQGTRLYKDVPTQWVKLGRFDTRILELLNISINTNESGEIEPPSLIFTDEAQARWIEFYNDVERELAPGGEMENARDIACKAADNVARMAADFHILQYGPCGQICAEDVLRAARIVTWYMYESRRFLSEIILPPNLKNAINLADKIINYCKKNKSNKITAREISQYAPNYLRHQKQAIKTAIGLLATHRHLFLAGPKGQQYIVNPRLLGD